MAEQQPNDQRSVTNAVIAPSVLAELARQEKATRVADALQATRPARDAARKGGK